MDPVAAPSRLRTLPSWLLSQTTLAVQRLVTDALDGVGAHRSHYSVLSALEEFGPASQADLCRRCGIDRSDMVALLDELGGPELLSRAPDPQDRRRNVVTITAAGRRRLKTLDGVLADAQERVLRPLGSAEREQLVRSLTRLVEHHAGG